MLELRKIRLFLKADLKLVDFIRGPLFFSIWFEQAS
jgi:hypothetical protein